MNYISEKYNIPNRQDYEKVGRLLSTILTHDLRSIDWEKVPAFVHSAPVSERAKTLLPRSQLDLDRVLLSGNNSLDPSNRALALAREISITKRSVEWIEANGICLDNIIPGKSSYPQAGKGAIAQRFMNKDDLIAPAPLLQITNMDTLRMPAIVGELLFRS